MTEKLRADLEVLKTIAKKLVAKKLSDGTNEYTNKEIDEIMENIDKLEKQINE